MLLLGSFDKLIKGAIFVELPKPISQYPIDKYPFVYIACFEEALRVAEIDLEFPLEINLKSIISHQDAFSLPILLDVQVHFLVQVQCFIMKVIQLLLENSML
jgi:hypothetical protein